MSDPTGIPLAGVDFFAELELNNDKAWWAEHKKLWESAVRDPLVRLTTALAEEFGPAKLFRPYRDVRFSADKSPYKTHQGAVVETAPFMGYYVQVSSQGLMVGGGWYAPEPAQVARFRSAVDDDETGPQVQELVDELAADGVEIGGEELKTNPRGFSADHPRAALLRHKSLLLSRQHGTPGWLETSEVVDRVRDDWRSFRPLLTWLAINVGGAGA